MNKWFISVTAGKQQEPSIQKCKDLGLKVVTIDESPNAVGHRLSDLSIVKKLNSITSIIEKLNQHNISPIAALSFVSDAGALCAAGLREHFKIDGISKKIQLVLLNKHLLKNKLEMSKVNQPKFYVSTHRKEIKHYANIFNYNCIIKPTIGSGSRGVNFINSKLNIDKLITDCFSHADNNGIIIENYIQGSEYSIETFCDNGKVAFLAFSKRDINIYNSATAIFTLNLKQSLIRKIKNEILKVYKVFDYPNGPGHFELIVDDYKDCYLIDVAFRGGGFMIYNHLVEKVSGFNIIKNTILQTLGEKIRIKDNYDLKRYVIIKLIQGKKGVVKSISGFTEANTIKGIQAFPYVSVGETVTETFSDSARLGIIISEGRNYRIAKERINNTLRLVKIGIN